jgi:hypothetical protein
MCELPSGSSHTPISGSWKRTNFWLSEKGVGGGKLASLEADVGPGLIIEDVTEKTETLETSGVGSLRNVRRNVNAVGSRDSQYISYLVYLFTRCCKL